jgi:CMP-N,N'-diacetyllegionaminic acid synthase
MNKSVDAFVGVRSGSQRVKNKNTKPFGDTTLLDLKLETLKQVSNLKNIIVSSDCDNMLSIAKNHGVDTHKRSVYHASNECTNSEYFEMIADVVESENVMYAPVTSPFVSVETFNT